jgi:hypothetical protein
VQLAATLDSEMARYQVAAIHVDVDTTVVFTGEGADLIEDLPPAVDMITRLAADAERGLAEAADRIV